MAVTGTGKNSTVKGVFATQDSHMGANRAGSLPGHGPVENARDAGALKQVQTEVDVRAAARRARGVVEDDEPGHA